MPSLLMLRGSLRSRTSTKCDNKKNSLNETMRICDGLHVVCRGFDHTPAGRAHAFFGRRGRAAKPSACPVARRVRLCMAHLPAVRGPCGHRAQCKARMAQAVCAPPGCCAATSTRRLRRCHPGGDGAGIPPLAGLQPQAKPITCVRRTVLKHNYYLMKCVGLSIHNSKNKNKHKGKARVPALTKGQE
jgi:hypothetical protein